MGKSIVEEAKESVKNKQKQEKGINMKKIIITTVAITLFVIAAFAGTFYLGTQYERAINNRVNDEAKSLTAVISASKE